MDISCGKLPKEIVLMRCGNVSLHKACSARPLGQVAASFLVALLACLKLDKEAGALPILLLQCSSKLLLYRISFFWCHLDLHVRLCLPTFHFRDTYKLYGEGVSTLLVCMWMPRLIVDHCRKLWVHVSSSRARLFHDLVRY